MKQLFATGTVPASAPTVTASSVGVKADELSAALTLAAYTPPPRGADGPLPVRLALLNTPSAGRVLAHVAPRRDGYFAHALLNVPPTADAQLAIQTWGSPLWQRNDPGAAGDLPDLPYLPVADVLDDARLTKWLDAAAHRELLEFALSALLAAPADGRVFLAAAAADVAQVVYATTRALPPGLLDEFTFSTYEPDPLGCPARLVGHESGTEAAGLPPACYAAPNSAFHSASGRRSDLPAVPFAAFAVQALADGDFARLDEVKATWQRLGLKEPRHFDLVYRLAHSPAAVGQAEAAEALRLPAVASWVAARPEPLDQFLGWALADREFANQSFSRAVQAVRQKPDLVAKLAQTVREEGLKALRAGDADRAATALEVILPMAAPAKAAAVWGELPAQLGDPDGLAWPVRWYLLPRFARFKQQHQPGAGVDPALEKWLAVPADRLGELLALDLPRAYLLAAGRAVLARDDEPTAALAGTLAKHPKLALALLRAADGDDRAVKLFEALLAAAPDRLWLDDLLAAAADYPAGLLHRFFEAALAAGAVDADRAVRTHGPKLLELFAGRSGLEKVGKLFLAAPPADLLHNTGVLDFLTALRRQENLSAELADRVEAIKAVKAYLDAPDFNPDAMAASAAALGVQPPAVPPAAKAEVFDAVARTLLARAAAETLQDDLEAVLVRFGDALATGPADLYENMLRDLRGRADVGRSPNLVHAFLAVALGAVKSPDLAGKLDGLDGHAFAVASEAAKRGGRRVLAALDRRAEAWPKDARSKWAFLHTAVRPAGAKRLLRDAAVFLAGAAVATAAWWAVQVFGRGLFGW
jgi:hypothetical protein